MNESTNQQMRYCGNCGAQMRADAPYCPNCGHPSALQQPQQHTQQPTQPYQPQYVQKYPQQYQQPMCAAGFSQPQPQVVVVNQKSQSNGLGTTGFICALLAILLSWIPGLDWILWLLGLIFSLIGCFKAPRGLAIAGLVISLLDLLLLVAIIGTLGAAVGAASAF